MATNTGAAEYRYLYSWFQMSRSSDGTTGDQPKSYGISPYTNTSTTGGSFRIGTATATLWGTEELQSDLQEKLFGTIRTTWVGWIRLRNVLTDISAQDLIQGGYANRLYKIDGLRIDWANNQTFLDVRSLDFNVV